MFTKLYNKTVVQDKTTVLLHGWVEWATRDPFSALVILVGCGVIVMLDVFSAQPNNVHYC